MNKGLSFQQLQTEVGVWRERNFPSPDAVNSILGLIEELGELSHHFLKRREQIRLEEDHNAGIRDSVGDIMIYLANFCNLEGISLMECIEITWSGVKERDWVKHRQEHQAKARHPQ